MSTYTQQTSHMSLLTLPAELRLKIYEHLPALYPNSQHNISPTSALTPAICRTNTILRRETLPIYASDSLFAVCIDDSPVIWKCRIDSWISALGSTALSRIGSLQISRHWKLLQPQRWQGHVGFYIRIDKHSRKRIPSEDVHSISSVGKATDCPVGERRGLHVTTGTYPMYVCDPVQSSIFFAKVDQILIILTTVRVRDSRNMRSESIELLAIVFGERIRPSYSQHEIDHVQSGLSGADIRFLLEAIEVVASYKMPHEFDEASTPERRREILEDMEEKLRALDLSHLKRPPVRAY